MRIRFLFLILFLSSILSCTQENNSPYSYRLLGSEFVETSRPISPSDSVVNIECIKISIQNNRLDSIKLIHDKKKILNSEGVQAFGKDGSNCDYTSIIDRTTNYQTIITKGHSQIFYLEKPNQQKDCKYDSVKVWITSIGISESGTFSMPLVIRIE